MATGASESLSPSQGPQKVEDICKRTVGSSRHWNGAGGLDRRGDCSHKGRQGITGHASRVADNEAEAKKGGIQSQVSVLLESGMRFHFGDDETRGKASGRRLPVRLERAPIL